MVERLMCTISYDGTNYSGYQIQPNGRTVQEELESALTKMHKGQHVRVTASGRTDAGVHAWGQVIHFDSPLTIPTENWKKALNTLLPNDVYVCNVKKVADSFHARFDVKEKEYRYFIMNRKEIDIFNRDHTLHVKQPLDIEVMNEACSLLEGEHDFSSFCAANTGVKGDKIRTIYHASCYQEEDQIVFVCKGSGFLYNMVRIIVGTLIEIGTGSLTPSHMKQVLDAKDRVAAGKTAPPQGLFLWRVVYNEF
ncbi:tRNA pseudouridine(38-40) synthase TruA [Aquibacillus sediminis]|uniref:tRNA pseudouridine(38-40) synthase TruA n=1 Tax=Aquibacillus sediminis TaxID=2574734 RepID=UPI001108203B|nr:tRNA pseudouridine(38-40) synthase TruA [Aquibacillus sediminis]